MMKRWCLNSCGKLQKLGLGALLAACLLLPSHAVFAQGADLIQEAKTAVELGDYAEAEGILQEALRQDPTNYDARFWLARSMAFQDRYDEALNEYNYLIDLFPNNTDYLLGKAQTLVWAGRSDEALPMIDELETLNPYYEDVARLKISALVSMERYDEAIAATDDARARFPSTSWETPEKPNPKHAPVPPNPYLVELGSSFSDLTNRFDGWNSQYVFVEKTFNQDSASAQTVVLPHGIYARARRTNRFDLTDHEFTGGAYFPVTENWAVTGEASVSTTRRVLPEWSAFGQVQRKLPYKFVANAGYRHSEYKTGIVELGVYTLEKYFGKYRVAYTLFQSYLHGADTVYSHLFQGNYYYGDRNVVGFGVSFGEEQQNVRQGANINIVTLDNITLTASGIHWFKPDWGITYTGIVTSFDNETINQDLYTRRGLQVGIRHLF